MPNYDDLMKQDVKDAGAAFNGQHPESAGYYLMEFVRAERMKNQGVDNDKIVSDFNKMAADQAAGLPPITLTEDGKAFDLKHADNSGSFDVIANAVVDFNDSTANSEWNKTIGRSNDSTSTGTFSYSRHLDAVGNESGDPAVFKTLTGPDGKITHMP